MPPLITLQRRAVRLLGAATVAVLAACASAPDRDDGAALGRPSFVLLGELHDNPTGHAQRLADLTRRLDAGWRPVLAMEQFDLNRSDDLARAMQQCSEAACVVAQAGGAGWDWPLYHPVIQLALDRGIPLVAANVSRDEARRVMREGLAGAFTPAVRAAYALPEGVPAELRTAHEREIIEGHCGHAPANLLPGMVAAQIARDIGMAQALLTHATPDGAVLLAGNGHVRRDIGVPYWLRQQGVRHIEAVAYTEGAAESAAPGTTSPFDRVVPVPPAPREDPCALFKAQAAGLPISAR